MNIDNKYLIDPAKTKKELDAVIVSSLNAFMIEEKDREAVAQALSIGFQQGMLWVAEKYKDTDSLEFGSKIVEGFEKFAEAFMSVYSVPEEARESYKQLLLVGYQRGSEFSIQQFTEKLIPEAEEETPPSDVDFECENCVFTDEEEG